MLCLFGCELFGIPELFCGPDTALDDNDGALFGICGSVLVVTVVVVTFAIGG